MKVKDLIKNDTFDVNAEVKVYRVPEGVGGWQDMLLPTAMFYGGSLCNGDGTVLEDSIRYITVEVKYRTIIIEV